MPANRDGVKCRGRWPGPDNAGGAIPPVIQRGSQCQRSLSTSVTSVLEVSTLLAKAESSQEVQEVGGRHTSQQLQEAAAAASQQLMSMPADSVARLAWGYAILQVCNAELAAALPAALYSRLTELSGGLLARALWSCAKIGTGDSELFAAATDFLLEALPGLDAQDLTLVAVAYALVDHYEDDDDFFDALAAAAEARLELFSPQQLADLMWAFATLRHRSPPLLEAGARAAGTLGEQLTVNQASQVVWSLARLGAGPLPLLPALADTAALRLAAAAGRAAAAQLPPPPMPLSDLARLAHSLALTGQYSGALAAVVRNSLRKRNPLEVSEADRARLFQAQLVAGEMGAPGPLPPDQLPLYFAAWAAQEESGAVRQDSRERSWQLRQPELQSRPAMLGALRTTLTRLGVTVPPRPQLTLDGLFQVDLCVEAGGQRAALEPVMSWECCRNAPYTPLAEAEARWRSLRHRRWRVAPLPWNLWACAGSEDARAELLDRLLRSAT